MKRYNQNNVTIVGSLKIYWSLVVLLCSISFSVNAQQHDLPKILSDKSTKSENYLPDFSYAGYHFSEIEIPTASKNTVVNIQDFVAIPNDGIDDSKAVLKAVKVAHETKGAVVLQFPAGRFIISDILYITRSNITLRGAGSGLGGTTLYYPRPLKFFSDPPELKELREYLVELNKIQKEKENNLALPFSQYAWSGGMIWTMVPGERVKSYLDTYDKAPVVLTKLVDGNRGEHELKVASVEKIKVGDVVQIQWFNKEGENGSFLSNLYDNNDLKALKVGSHHWKYPNHALVSQKVLITHIKGKKIQIKDPLLHDIKKAWTPIMAEWKHLEEVGIEHFNIEFPMAANIAHHVEDGYNAMYLTRLYNGWVKDVQIKNADSGILTEEISNVTIQDIETNGLKKAHYSVAMGSVHNVLVQNLVVQNKVTHPLSFNTMATKSVYKDCKVYQDPILDQHSGANHQNLFDQIEVWVTLDENKFEYPLFGGGGASYWKPSHGAFSTFWNIRVNFTNYHDNDKVVTINGMKDGAAVRLIGVYGNKKIDIDYNPSPYIEAKNVRLIHIPSLFNYQLLARNKK
tara:strand:- start:12602 stop:14314 length:1713 start_codon:yes stop_codon:yes gene_type:complete